MHPERGGSCRASTAGARGMAGFGHASCSRPGMKATHSTLLAIVLLASAAGFAIAHGLGGGHYGVDSPDGRYGFVTVVFDLCLGAAWGACALGLFVRTSLSTFLSSGLGAGGVAAYGLTYGITTHDWRGGTLLVGAGALTAVGLYRGWSGRVVRRERRERALGQVGLFPLGGR